MTPMSLWGQRTLTYKIDIFTMMQTHEFPGLRETDDTHEFAGSDDVSRSMTPMSLRGQMTSHSYELTTNYARLVEKRLGLNFACLFVCLVFQKMNNERPDLYSFALYICFVSQTIKKTVVNR